MMVSMNSFVGVFVCFALVASIVHAIGAILSNDVVASYTKAFENYQVKFNKFYDTKEEYDKRLRAYAVCFKENELFFK